MGDWACKNNTFFQVTSIMRKYYVSEHLIMCTQSTQWAKACATFIITFRRFHLTDKLTKLMFLNLFHLKREIPIIKLGQQIYRVHISMIKSMTEVVPKRSVKGLQLDAFCP